MTHRDEPITGQDAQAIGRSDVIGESLRIGRGVVQHRQAKSRIDRQFLRYVAALKRWIDRADLNRIRYL